MKTPRYILLAAAACLLLAGCAKNKAGETGDKTGGAPEEAVSGTTDFKPAGEPSPANPTPATNVGEETPAMKLEKQLQPVFFAFDKYDLSQESRDRLTKNAETLRQNPGFAIVVEGHCDERGTNEYNLALGDRRARAARDFLIAAGIPASRFSIVSYGEERPFAYGHDESAWWQNRRAHFRVPEPN